MTDDMRAVLEGILYGDDPKILPADRLRAAAELRALDAAAGGQEVALRDLIWSMPPDELAHECDHVAAARVRALLGDTSVCGYDDPDEWPETRAALEAAVAARAEERARALAGLKADEDEIQARAEARAEELYRARAFAAVRADDAAAQAPAAPQPPEQPTVAPGLPPGLTWEEIQRPWRRRRRPPSPFSWDQ